MNVDLKQTFARVKPVCDIVMMCPTTEAIAQFTTRVSELKKEAVQELQQYLLFPLITHIKSTEIEKKYELQWRIIDAIRMVLEKVTVFSFEMCIKIETGLLSLVFDNSKPGMIAEVPEELKLSVMKCLTVLLLNIDDRVRKKMLRTQVPLIAQAVFVSVHMAKLEKLKALRLAAVESVTAHTVSHRQLTDEQGHITDVPLEALAVDVLASILPGVLAALQDVASQAPHAVVVAAIDATHRILCLTMNDKYLPKQSTVTAEDFAKMISSKQQPNLEVSSKEKKPADVPKRSAAWFALAGAKLALVTRRLAALAAHDHPRVRRELALYCARLLAECPRSMQPSVPICLDTLIALSQDEYSEVSAPAAAALAARLAEPRALDALADGFLAMLTRLPRELNSADSNRKLSAMSLLHGYMEVMCDEGSPQRLTAALGSEQSLQCLVAALLEAAAVDTDLMLLMRTTARDGLAPAPMAVPDEAAAAAAPWRRARHAAGAAGRRLRAALARLGGARAAPLLLDRLPPASPAAAALLNDIASAPNAPPELTRRVIDMYIEESVWNLPLEVGGAEPSPGAQDTRDVTVYDPRAWTKDSVPGLFEGATETRVTGVSYGAPRAPRAAAGACGSLAEAQRNMALACTLTEGLGRLARRLGPAFQPYLLKTLGLVLERAGSPYEMLRQAGAGALAALAAGGGLAGAAALVRCNADYFASQVAARLGKPWSVEPALRTLAVVLEHSDGGGRDWLCGLVDRVLLQSLDKYHERYLQSYLQVFLTFVTCIRRWFPEEPPPPEQRGGPDLKIDILKDLMEYVSKTEEIEKLMKEGVQDKKSAEEMYREDQDNSENVTDYYDKVTEEPPGPPRHVAATAAVLRRCVHFAAARDAELAILALQALRQGLPALRGHADALLPLVHAAWPPLVTVFEAGEAIVVRRALDLLVTMAELSQDFIRHRAITDVLPHIEALLLRSARDSRRRDRGSAYRAAPRYRLQLAALAALARLPPALALGGDALDRAMDAVAPYLSRNQPKPLQELAVSFFKAMLEYDYGAAWLRLRARGGGARPLRPPRAALPLAPATAPCPPADPDLHANFNLIFEGIDMGE